MTTPAFAAVASPAMLQRSRATLADGSSYTSAMETAIGLHDTRDGCRAGDAYVALAANTGFRATHRIVKYRMPFDR